tara:strand:+ start:580 stop:888 length:309 start_codon:yes stop_codon:yes gene_type:complete
MVIMMKKLLGIVVLGLLLSGCATNKDGSYSLGLEGSLTWHATAGHQELVAYFLKSDVDEICHNWKWVAENNENFRIRNRNAMKEALKAKGEDPLICMKLKNL